MFAQRLLHVFLITFLLVTAQACTDTDGKQNDTTFKQLPGLQAIKPKKPVKIKLKRSTAGNYSWDLSGSDVDEVIKVDKRLRESLGKDK